jgi:ABC-type glycerol-3-phosphate transport system permease component
MSVERFKRLVSRIPLHTIIISLAVIWLVPTLGVFVTSFRSREAVRASGWWMVFSKPPIPSQAEYQAACQSCHGADGRLITACSGCCGKRSMASPTCKTQSGRH